MRIDYRSYSSEYYRPSPVVQLSDDQRILSVVTSWGSKDDSKKILSKIHQISMDDDTQELTSPFGKIESLGHVGNQLRTISLLANEEIYRDSNKHDFVSALEVLTLCHHEQTIFWVSIGCPHILLFQRGTYQLLNFQVDLSWQLNQPAPILSRGLGLERLTHMNSGRIFIDSEFEIILVNRASLPAQLFANPSGSLEKIHQLLVQDNSEVPFWLASVQPEPKR